MKIRFVGLLPEHQQRIVLADTEPVARFELEAGGDARVLARDIHPYSDLDVRLWRPELRESVFTALCAQVEEAGWADEEKRTLDLASRFTVSSDRDVRPWNVRGFTHLQTCDLKLIKHVLGEGSRDPRKSVEWWSRLLGVSIEPEPLLKELNEVGCVDWQFLRANRDANDSPIRLYRSLSRPAQAKCIRLLSPLREAYLRAVHQAILTTSMEQDARHVHLDTAAEETMHFLDDRGLLVIAKGSNSTLTIATSFDAHVDGEDHLGPRTLGLRRAKALEEGRGHALFHTPQNWQPRLH
jgi:hypothetical protein